MKLFFIKLFILSAALFMIPSCRDPIFFKIFEETPILDPLIDGSPTNFVQYNNKLYVASGKRIYEYNGSRWSGWKTLNDKVISLASGTNLYAIYLNNNKGIIRQFDSAGAGTDLSTGNAQSIHVVGNYLFISILNSASVKEGGFTIFYKTESALSFTKLDGNYNSILYGVASDLTNLYLCVNDEIIVLNKSTLVIESSFPARSTIDGYTGIINTSSTCAVAISKEGRLYQITGGLMTNPRSFTDERESTGGLGLWCRTGESTPCLLLIGRRELYYSSTTSYSNGYVEIDLDPSGEIRSGAGFNEPGKRSPSSIDNNEQYSSSIGIKPVNYFIQPPAAIDPSMTLFASTQQSGVWSYRVRDGSWQWNAEQ